MDSRRKSVPASPNSKAARAESGWAHVYAVVKTIPRGRVITYGQLAKALRLPGGARTAGRAMAGCKSGMGVPWHRVLGSGGHILLREPVASLQRRLLESEGVKFSGLRVQIKDHGWTIPARVSKKHQGKRARRR